MCSRVGIATFCTGFSLPERFLVIAMCCKCRGGSLAALACLICSDRIRVNTVMPCASGGFASDVHCTAHFLMHNLLNIFH